MTYSQRTFGSRHVYQRKFFMSKAVQPEAFEDKAEYSTRCSSRSSVWNITVVLRKQSPFDNFRMYVNLVRTDADSHHLKADLQVWLMDADGKRCPDTHQLKCKLKGHKMASQMFVLDDPSQCGFKCLLRSDRLTFPRDILMVKYTLEVSGCHPATDGEQDPGEISSPASEDDSVDEMPLSNSSPEF